MATGNSTIAQLATDFGKLQSDISTLITAIKAFVASVQSGSSGTVLSEGDAATLTGIDTAVTALDATVQGISIPAVTPPATSGSTTPPATS